MRGAMRAVFVCVASGSMIGASLLGVGLARSQADPEDDYLRLVKRVAVTDLPNDATLSKLGHGVCNFLNKSENHTLDAVQGTLDAVMEFLDGTNADKGHDSGVIVYAAAQYLCPANLSLVEAWKNS